MANDKQNLNPYAGGEAVTGDADDGGRATRSTARKEAIPRDDLHSMPQARPMPREDINGYAPKGAGTSAGREDSNQLGDRNTGRGVRDGMVETVTTAADNRHDMGRGCYPEPMEPTPYANTSTNSADRRDADGQ